MAAPTEPGSSAPEPPPEVPEEFAAAYRAAYDEALQSSEGSAEPVRPDGETIGPSPERGLSSEWLIPALLVLFALIVVLLAYAALKS